MKLVRYVVAGATLLYGGVALKAMDKEVALVNAKGWTEYLIDQLPLAPNVLDQIVTYTKPHICVSSEQKAQILQKLPISSITQQLSNVSALTNYICYDSEGSLYVSVRDFFKRTIFIKQAYQWNANNCCWNETAPIAYQQYRDDVSSRENTKTLISQLSDHHSFSNSGSFRISFFYKATSHNKNGNFFAAVNNHRLFSHNPEFIDYQSLKLIHTLPIKCEKFAYSPDQTEMACLEIQKIPIEPYDNAEAIRYQYKHFVHIVDLQGFIRAKKLLEDPTASDLTIDQARYLATLLNANDTDAAARYMHNRFSTPQSHGKRKRS